MYLENKPHRVSSEILHSLKGEITIYRGACKGNLFQKITMFQIYSCIIFRETKIISCERNSFFAKQNFNKLLKITDIKI